MRSGANSDVHSVWDLKQGSGQVRTGQSVGKRWVITDVSPLAEFRFGL